MAFARAKFEFEYNYWTALLARNKGSIRRTAMMAGVNRTHIYRRLKVLGIKRVLVDVENTCDRIAASYPLVGRRLVEEFVARD